jgi:hypothetical protein
MGEDRSSRHDRPNERHGRLRTGDGVRFLLRGEEQILQSITAGAPLPELLNRICSALDCEIGNVASLVSLLDDDATHFAAIAGNAKRFGLHKFCSIGVFAETQELLGTLEMYSSEPDLPSPDELELIEHAGCLAAIAIERENGTVGEAVAAEMRPVRKRVLEWPKTVN